MIARDGASISLWQDTSGPHRVKKDLGPDTQYDVILVGGGITGISTALLLQRAGLRCAVLEAHTLCFGTTGGTTAHLNTLMDTPYPTIIKNFGKDNAKLVARAAKEALELIRNNVSEYSIDCGFEDARAFLFSQDDEQSKELEELSKACAEVGLGIERPDDLPIPIPFESVLAVNGQAKFHPVIYVESLAKAFEDQGGVIVQHCRVLAAENKERLSIRTERGEFHANYLIYATHIPPGVSLLNLRCAPYRSYAMAVELRGDGYPDDLTYDMYDPYHYYRTQKIDGRNYLIVGGEDHKTAHAENTEACFRRLEAHIHEHFEVREIAYRWSSQYFEPVDGLPYIGHMPGQPGRILVATGFGGNGMTYSSVAALLLRDLVLGVKNEYAGLFDPNRLKPIAGFSNFIKENADVAGKLLGKILPAEKLGELAGLAPGEGQVVSYEGHLVAIYKDENGGLHPLHAACTHMKCNVTWNAAERSWDCPCHGARYDIDGTVLTGPADMNLERLELK